MKAVGHAAATPSALLTIGELALRSGVSAKALRLYEQRGLLKPTTHSTAGYRLYGPAALAQLMQILLLRRSGFTLAQIAELMTAPAVAGEVIDLQIATLEREVASRLSALNRLRQLRQRLDHHGQRTSPQEDQPAIDHLLEQIAMTQHLEVPLTDSERQAMMSRAQALGESTIAQAEQAWPVLIAEVRAAMAAGSAVDDPAVSALARRWFDLVQAATGGDANIARKIGEAYQQQPAAMAAQGMDMEMFKFIGAAMAQIGLKLF